jgi:hypothetical protein
MKTPFLRPLLAAALLLTAATSFAAKPADDRPKLVIVVVDNIQRHESAITAFDYLDLGFQHVAAQRKWPVAIVAERFAANTPDHETVLQIFNQPLRQETPGELTFRGWMTLTVKGVEHDFGIVTFRYYPRFGEPADDIMEKMYRGAANAAADKIEPILFPKPAATPKS